MLSLLSSIARNRRRSRGSSDHHSQSARSLRERSSANELGRKMTATATVIAGLVAFGLACFVGAMLLDRRGGPNG